MNQSQSRLLAWSDQNFSQLWLRKKHIPHKGALDRQHKKSEGAKIFPWCFLRKKNRPQTFGFFVSVSSRNSHGGFPHVEISMDFSFERTVFKVVPKMPKKYQNGVENSVLGKKHWKKKTPKWLHLFQRESNIMSCHEQETESRKLTIPKKNIETDASCALWKTCPKHLKNFHNFHITYIYIYSNLHDMIL